MNENQIEIVMQACYSICAMHGALRTFVDILIAEKTKEATEENATEKSQRELSNLLTVRAEL